MIKINLEIGDPVIKTIPDLGDVHAEIYSIKVINGGIWYTLKLTPKGYIEETIVEGMFGFNKKEGCDFWDVKRLEDGTILAEFCHRGMFRPDINEAEKRSRGV